VGYEFEWNRDKAVGNARNHGVTFAEATTVFGDPLAMNKPDPSHSQDEHRFILLGQSDRYRLLVVAYAERPPRTRLISARLASRRERKQYEESST